MILVDTSAWIEFLRDTGSPVCERVDALLASEIARHAKLEIDTVGIASA